ncbi:serine-threonine/tyrosine-protein kinase catalytic domain-containing protein [Tanacetum coccineum]
MKDWKHLQIPFGEIESAIIKFNLCIERGGYGWVYKGVLFINGKDTVVAVKRLNEKFGQGLKKFMTENESLDKYVSRGNKSTLTWLQRLKICDDAACGLYYLHNHVGGRQTIIHRDIKSSNILINENWVGKISDLGLSKLKVTGYGLTDKVSSSCGTPGYGEPEYFYTGIVTTKSNVFSFEIILLKFCVRGCASLITVMDSY